MSTNLNQIGKLCENTECVWTTWKPHTHRSHADATRVYPTILHTIGDTPLVKLNKLPQAAGLKCDVYVKIEFFNPGGSIKDRIGFRMVSDAEEQGRLKPGCTVIEPTSGNTGIGLAMACAVKGYKCMIVMPEKMSDEKVATLKILGAEVIRTPTEAAHDDPEGLIMVAQRLNREIPNSVILDQYSNPGNPLAHFDGTGEEIVRQCGGSVDMVVVGAGTGGSITGISRKLKERCPNCVVVGVDPEGSILSQPESLNVTDVKFYEIEGLGYDFIPNVLHRECADRWLKTNDKIAFQMIRRLIREEGILSGGSSGAAVAAALVAAKDLQAGQKCVVILPDGIRNYMTKFVTDNWLEARRFKEIKNEHNHWWWNNTVADLPLSATKSITSNTTCADALAFLKTNKLERAPVADDDGKLVGFLALKYLTKKLVSQNYRLTDSIEKALFKQFRREKDDTLLGLVSRILETDEFVAVVDESDHCTSVITHLDLLTFISSGPNSLKNGHAPVQNGHAPIQNGHTPIQKGHAPLQNGHAPVQNGHPPSQNGHGTIKNGH